MDIVMESDDNVWSARSSVDSVDGARPNKRFKQEHVCEDSGALGGYGDLIDTRSALECLPDNVIDDILALLLIKDEPIEIDFTWLRHIITNRVKLPRTKQTLSDGFLAHSVPVDFDDLKVDVEHLERAMVKCLKALEVAEYRMRPIRSPGRGLCTALLRVNRRLNAAAAPIFYGGNQFRFSCASTAWMWLDVFLSTIGSNVAHLHHIRIHAPMWNRGVTNDYLEGAIVDAITLALKFKINMALYRDRLLACIQRSVRTLLKVGALTSLIIELPNGVAADRWAGCDVNDRCVVRTEEATEYVERKAKGVALLKSLSEFLAPNYGKPVLSVYKTSKPEFYEVREFEERWWWVVVEARKYGWEVDETLGDAW